MAKQKKTTADAVCKPEKINRKTTAKDAVRKPAPNRKGREPVLKITPEMWEERRRREAEQDAIYEERMMQEEIALLEYPKRAVENMRERGFVFIPSDAVLVDFYLRVKNHRGGYLDLCPIEEVDVYGTHPQTLTEKYNSNGGVWHFFTKSRPNENSGQEWEFGEKNDVFCNGVKVGVRQELEYGGGGNVGGKYKMMEYQLVVDPAAAATETNSEAAAAAAPWFICKLYNGVTGTCAGCRGRRE